MKKTLLLACLAAALALPASASAAGTYTVRFLPNGGTGTMAAQTFVRDKAGRLSANAFVRTGYVFIGWAKTKTGPVKYKNKKAVKNLAKAGKTAKLYAVWAKKKYKVAFKPNGGTGTMDAEAFAYGRAKRLRANAFTRTGYTFAGWAKTSTGAKVYANKQYVKNLTTKGGTVRLYAVWTGKKATYNFKANGGTGTMAAQTFTVGTAQALRANAFKKSGYVFLGWSTSAAGSVKYADRQKVSTPASTGGKTVTLYAVWGGDTVLVSGGTNAGKNPDSALGSYSLEVSSFRMDRTEVPWALWRKVRDWGVSHGYAFENDGVGKGEDHPVCSVNWYDCVKWCNARSEMEGLAPAYKTNGEVYRKGRSVPGVAEGGPGYRLPTGAEWEYAARGGRVGSRFPWGDAISHLKANYTGGSATYDTSDGPHAVYATGAYPYTAPVGSFEANGFGLFDMAGNVAEWTWDVVTPGRGVRGGGFDTSDCRCGFVNYHEQDKVRASLGFRTVRRPAYTLKFGANGGTGTMDARTGLVPGADVVIPANGFSRADWKFVGWSTSATGDAMWTAGATKKGGFVPRSGTEVTLYAVWVRKSYTVRFAANGGSGSMAAQTVPIGVATLLPPNAFQKEDCAFAGWATSAGGGVAFADGEAVVNLSTTDGGTVTLYAVWTRDAYYVSFDPNDDTYAAGPAAIGTMADQRMRFDVGANLDTNAFVKVGWVFGGWATNRTGEAVYADGQTVTNLTASGSTTLYATWWGGAATVQSGSIQMPVNPFTVVSSDRAILLDATEVTIESWTAVRDWAIENGYDFGSPGDDSGVVGLAKGAGHPVHSVSWYDCVKWCNARSEMEGLDPVYRLSGDVVYRTGQNIPEAPDRSKTGYRLPTGGEWMFAANGGYDNGNGKGSHFPWGSGVIDSTLANYKGRSPDQAVSGVTDNGEGYNPNYAVGGFPYTAPVGSFDPTGSTDPEACFLCDMAGNVAEWAGDIPDDNASFVVLGGGWDDYGVGCRWYVGQTKAPGASSNNVGFRTVRTISE